MFPTSLLDVLSSQMKPQFPHGLVRMSLCCMLMYLFLRCLLPRGNGRLTYTYPPTTSLCLPSVSFIDCGKGSSLRFESSYPADFRIGQDGTVYATRTLRISDRKEWSLEISAKDKERQGVWLTQVSFTLPDTPKQVSLRLYHFFPYRLSHKQVHKNHHSIIRKIHKANKMYSHLCSVAFHLQHPQCILLCTQSTVKHYCCPSTLRIVL